MTLSPAARILFGSWLVLGSCGQSPADLAAGNALASRGSTGAVAAASSTVLGTTEHVTTRLVTLRTRESTLVTTPDHPFAKVGTGWTHAGELSVGDRIETLPAPTGTPVLAIEVREVPPTPVYNLTVARTHAYFVGSDALLVHNVDCRKKPPGSDILEREARELREKQESARQLLAEQRKRRIAAEREKRRLVLNDTRGWRGMRNCAYCTYAGLSDADKLSLFLRENDMDDSVMPNLAEIRGVLRQLGLTSSVTPSIAAFPPTTEKRKRAKEIAAGNLQPRPGEVGAVDRDVKSFMQNSSANTFVVNVIFGDEGSHSMIGVRKEDGSIVFLDMQKKPPQTYAALDDFIHAVVVMPTDVDWRFNRQLYAALRDSTIEPVFEV